MQYETFQPEWIQSTGNENNFERSVVKETANFTYTNGWWEGCISVARENGCIIRQVEHFRNTFVSCNAIQLEFSWKKNM